MKIERYVIIVRINSYISPLRIILLSSSLLPRLIIYLRGSWYFGCKRKTDSRIEIAKYFHIENDRSPRHTKLRAVSITG